MCYKIDSHDSLFISTSSDENQIEITLPEPKPGKKWHLVCDTSQEDSFCHTKIKEDKFYQNPHSILIFEEK
jgi:pullulanase/glycogen debranching enzyme